MSSDRLQFWPSGSLVGRLVFLAEIVLKSSLDCLPLLFLAEGFSASKRRIDLVVRRFLLEIRLCLMIDGLPAIDHDRCF